MTEKKSPPKRAHGKPIQPPEPEMQIGDISHISGKVTIAGRDIVNKIQTIYERALTPGQVTEKDLEIEIDALASGLRDYLDGLKQQVLHPGSAVPYKELEAYTLSESQVFFGRSQSIGDVLVAMQRGRLTVLQAESGAGKTSLLQAGIVPGVIAMGNLALLLRPQFDNPGQAIKECFLGNLNFAPKLAGTRLVSFLHRVSTIIGHQATLYIVLDQFEEFFAKQTLETDRQEFIRDLAECLNDATLNVRWVISITTDRLGQLAKFEPLVRNPLSNVQSLYLFTSEQAAEVIAKTAQYHGLSFEEGLLQRILDDLGNGRGDPIAPTQIQLVCAALYKNIQHRGSLFTHAEYDEQGCAQGILHGYIDRVLQHDLPLEERPVAYKVLTALVTSEKKRLTRTKNDLELNLQSQGITPEALELTLDHLVTGRLLRRHGDDPHHIQYEIVHDYLLKEIEINDGAVKFKQAEELVEDGVKAWRRDRKFLLSKEQLSFVESQFHIQAFGLNQEKAEFLLLSAAVDNRDTVRWRNTLSKERAQAIASQSIRDFKSSDREVRRKSKVIAWALKDALPRNTYHTLYLERLFRKAWVPLLILVVVIGLAYKPAKTWLSYPEVSEWGTLPAFESQTHADLAHLALAVNLDNPDEIYVSDRSPDVLFTSTDGGKHWMKMNPKDIREPIVALSSVMGSTLYALSDQAVWVSDDRAQTWKPTADIPFVENDTLTSLAINPRNAAEVYVGSNYGGLYHTVNHGQSWEEISKEGYGGTRIKAVATNGSILILATDKGLWAKSMDVDQWRQLSLVGCDGDQELADQVSVLAIPYARNDPPEGITAIGYWAGVPGVGICDTDTENAFGTTLYYPLAQSFSSIAATGDVTLETHAYVGAASGIYRYRTWFSNDMEWWIIKLPTLLPKGGSI